ncbi:HrgA protein [Perkinsela sp. CCAP 1560/4]|nr:HrgA protein [Perkinsela sp. CCAP 1560/4]KNH07698.1 HrgA protein [Perkinsela sp. CCAP 1560/4]|eukprot:KNH04196.1 HrgA protein [Perkinsela sp. CCAP 1560/4]
MIEQLSQERSKPRLVTAPLTEADRDFLREYYFEAAERYPLGEEPPTEKSTFIITKVLSHRFLCTLFWSSLRKVPKPVVTSGEGACVNLAKSNLIEKSILSKGGDISSYTFKEMTFEVLRTASLPLTVGDIVAEGKNRGMLNTKGLSPEATLASELNCGLKRHGSAFPFGKIGPCYYLRRREQQVLTNILITPRYQRLGMRLWGNRYKYIPYEYEHRFLCYRTSSIGDEVGLGVFIRDGIEIPQGTILCEYTGIVTHVHGGHDEKNDSDEDILHPYSVNTGAGTPSESVIHGRDHNGTVQCYAALINDAGPANANASYVELEEAPGRVFVITKRQLMPGEEVLILYGCKYWNIDEYPTESKFSALGDWIGLLERCPASHPPGEVVIEKCLYCGTLNIPYRLMPLHATYECPDIVQRRNCEDDMQRGEGELNSLPVNEFTSFLPGAKRPTLSTSMVDVNDILTYSFTHEKVGEILERRSQLKKENESRIMTTDERTEPESILS